MDGNPFKLAFLALAILGVSLSLSGILLRLSLGLVESPAALACLAALTALPPLYYAYVHTRSKQAPLLRLSGTPLALLLLCHLCVQLSGGLGSPLFPCYAMALACLAISGPLWWIGSLAGLAAALEAAAWLRGEASAADAWKLLAFPLGALVGRMLARPEQVLEASSQGALSSRSFPVHPQTADLEENLPDFDAVSFIEQGTSRLMDMAFYAHPSWNALLLLWRAPEGELRLRAGRVRQGVLRKDLAVEAGDGLLGLAFKEQRRVELADLSPAMARALPHYEGAVPAKALAALPVLDEGKILAFLAVDRAKPGPWSADELSALDFLGRQIAAQVQQAAIFEKVLARGRQLFKLYALSRELAADLDRERLLSRLEEWLSSLLDFDSWYLALREEEGRPLVFVAGYGYAQSFRHKFHFDEQAALGGWVLGSGESASFHSGRSGGEVPAILREGMLYPGESFLLVPLVLKGRVLGMFKLDRRGCGGFSPQERQAMQIFASLLSVTLEHARLYALHQKLATTDGLTGLFNHRYFQERLAQEMEAARQKGMPLSLALTDIDHFKKINDQFGHQEGDRVLRQAAVVLREAVRLGCDVVCRYGGEEFAVILPDCDLVEARELMERLRRAGEATLRAGEDGKAEPVTFSVGFSNFPRDASKPAELIRLADEALYCAKRSGRNRVCSCKDLP